MRSALSRGYLFRDPRGVKRLLHKRGSWTGHHQARVSEKWQPMRTGEKRAADETTLPQAPWTAGRLARMWFPRAVTTWLARNSTALPTDSIILSNSGLESAGRREPKLLHAGRARSIQEAVSQALESKTSWEEDRDGEYVVGRRFTSVELSWTSGATPGGIWYGAGKRGLEVR